jgi:hypothetical protein
VYLEMSFTSCGKDLGIPDFNSLDVQLFATAFLLFHL